MPEPTRCEWAGTDPLMADYHDHDWGVPSHDSIVRHRGKIESTLSNARAIQRVREEFGTFDAYVWRSVGGSPIVGAYRDLAAVPAAAAEAAALSKDLERRGFRFAGPTTVYAFMQAAGLVDDHVLSCFRHGTGQGR